MSRGARFCALAVGGILGQCSAAAAAQGGCEKFLFENYLPCQKDFYMPIPHCTVNGKPIDYTGAGREKQNGQRGGPQCLLKPNISNLR
jgi:hypothetical protein